MKKLLLFLLFIKSFSLESLAVDVGVLPYLPKEIWTLILYFSNPEIRENFSLSSKSNKIFIQNIRERLY